MGQFRECVAAADNDGVCAGKRENRDDLPLLDADVEHAQARIVCKETSRPGKGNCSSDEHARGQLQQPASPRSSCERLSACDCAH